MSKGSWGTEMATWDWRGLLTGGQIRRQMVIWNLKDLLQLHG